MDIGATQLLRMLGSGVRPMSGPADGGAGGAAAPVSFANLLQQAREGSLTSAAPVSIAHDAGVECSEDQLARLSLAADKLEAAGVRSALINIDGQQLVLDVHLRQVIGPAKANNGLIAGIDGVMDLGDARSASQTGAGTAPAGTAGAQSAGLLQSAGGLAARNQSLLKLLAELPAA